MSTRHIQGWTTAGCAALFALVAALPGQVLAAEWKPEKRVEIVLGTGAGEAGGLNRNARLIREWLVKDGSIPESSTVLNKPGGGHALALNYTASQVGSGETIQLVNTPLITNSILGRSPITYKDFTPIALLYDETVVFTVPTKSGIKSAEDLIARLKQDPSSVVFSTATGLGTVQHIATLALAKSVGVDIKGGKLKTVNFSAGNAEAITAALGGRIDVVVSSPQPVLPFVESGDMRAIAVSSNERAGGFLANVPTWKELGVDSVIYAWRGIVAPKGITPEQVKFWDDTFAHLVTTDEWKEEVKKSDLNPRYLNSVEAAKFFEQETKRYSEIYNGLGLDVAKQQ